MKLFPPRREVAGQLGHEAEVRERGAGEATRPAAPGVADVGLRDERELAVAVQGSLGCSRGAGGEDDRHGPVGVRGQLVRSFPADAQVAQQRVGSGRGRDLDRVEPVRRETGCREDERRLGPVDHRGPLGRGEAVVHACSHRADLRGGEIRHQVLGPRWEHERDHRALRDTAAAHPDRSLVGGLIEERVRQRPAALGDVRGFVGEAACGLA